ncbi:MAG: redox-regulated ATPase YchF [Nanoarchaeota archaeon]|nr:redox-regulated ATPase YchF [Nanoarchaeota archaeon]MBU1501313.1 redox-regulated ATPase YchF [Nanoarchaeota archaeon]MBU2459424.1 redox-regulated ATPase YchF [Nanoarchaeota archaeon]
MLIGLVGKPSAGKSTFFKAATLAEVAIAAYPFTTIKPNTGVGYVKVECIDKEFNTKCNPSHGFCVDGKRFVPVEIMDVAGLVPGASEGKGLGNQFLDDLRQADAFIQVVDCSGRSNEKGEQLPEGKTRDPADDIKFLEEELNLWFYNLLMKVWKSFSKKTEMERGKFSEAVAKQFSGLRVKEEYVKDVLRNLNLSEKPSEWSEKQLRNFAEGLRRKSKPMIIAANKIDLPGAIDNYRKLRADFPNLNIVPCSADSELALREASKAGLIEYIPGEKDFKIIGELNEKQKDALEKIREKFKDFVGGTGVQSILNNAVFGLLSYIPIFPASANKLADSKGNILPDCFLLPPGSTALDFAYFLHTDFGENFIKAIDARTKKALGKNYELKPRDALEIVTR